MVADPKTYKPLSRVSIGMQVLGPQQPASFGHIGMPAVPQMTQEQHAQLRVILFFKTRP